MKKHLLVFLILLLGYSANSQDKGISIEVKLTPEMANFNQFFETDPKFTLGGGILVEKHLTNWLSGQTGIFYRNRGWQSKISLTDNEGNPMGEKIFKVSFIYLSFPVLLKGHINKFYGSVSPSLDVFLYDNSDSGFSTADINKLNASLYIAAGYKMDLNEKLYLNIEANYNPMLFAVFKDSQISSYNVGLGIGLGFAL